MIPALVSSLSNANVTYHSQQKNYKLELGIKINDATSGSDFKSITKKSIMIGA